jgi:indolepyruvate decarboxylase
MPRRRKVGRPIIVYPRGLAADGKIGRSSDIATAVNDLFDRHGPPRGISDPSFDFV